MLSPAYDLLPVNIIMPEDKEETALTLNGKKKNIKRKDFLIFAEGCGITQSAAIKMIDMLVSKKQKLLDMCEESLLPKEMKVQFTKLIEDRIEFLTL